MSGQLPQVPNYLPNIQSPFTAAVQGLQLGQAFGEAAGAQQQRESLQSAMQAFQRDPSSRTLTPLLTALPPQSAEQLRKHYEGMGAERRQETIGFGGQMFSLIMNGRTDLAKELATTRGTAARNAGDQANADLMDRVAQLVDVNPNAARDLLAVSLGATEEGKRAIESVFAARGAPTTERRAAAEAIGAEATAGVAPVVAGAGAARAVAQAQNEASPGLSEAATVRVNEAFTASDAARVRAGQLDELSARFAEQNSLGQFGRGGRAIVEAFGGDTEYGRLVREFTRLRNAEIVRALPPGPATDRDIELISRGFPGENASADSITAFLSAASRMAAYEADYNRFRGMFMDANRGSMGRAQRNFEIDGVTIPAGADMSSAFRRVITPRIEAQQNTQTLQDDPILRRFVQPPASQ
ncbi:hypothetical protein UFOVP670_62 [uncultured Caudovirales phage]|uniref:Acyltransferase n=1 Tax=uncultured Caudovirales phage TaxID=2100421 RepID=A0A6J5NFG3_9CAUD|nr:hypothetical protein UFOVP670_62 [uncultured Caudovirales phage]